MHESSTRSPSATERTPAPVAVTVPTASWPRMVPGLVAGRDLDWDTLMATAQPADCVPVAATDPLYILYTSGTTALPKGVVRDNGGHAVALRWSMTHLYDTQPGEVYWAASDVGWVVGHSYIVYAPLLTGCTTVLYEGKPVGKYLHRHDLSRLRYLFLAGERLDPDTYHWASKLLGVPVIDHWWQTETGWPIAANCLGIEHLPVKPGSPTKAVPGYDVQILGGDGIPVGVDTEGAVVIRLPLPPGTLPTLWHDDDRFVRSYLQRFPGYYVTGDGGHVDQDGYLFIMGRVDDVINVAGHRLSTGTMEAVLATHPSVAECAVIGVHDELKGQVPVGLVVLKAGIEQDPEALRAELIALIRNEVGAVASFKEVVVVDRLPKTRSGKILRGTMRSIADGQAVSVPSTIDDPAILDEIKHALVVHPRPQAGATTQHGAS